MGLFLSGHILFKEEVKNISKVDLRSSVQPAPVGRGKTVGWVCIMFGAVVTAEVPPAEPLLSSEATNHPFLSRKSHLASSPLLHGSQRFSPSGSRCLRSGSSWLVFSFGG